LKALQTPNVFTAGIERPTPDIRGQVLRETGVSDTVLIIRVVGTLQDGAVDAEMGGGRSQPESPCR